MRNFAAGSHRLIADPRTALPALWSYKSAGYIKEKEMCRGVLITGNCGLYRQKLRRGGGQWYEVRINSLPPAEP